MNGAAGRRWCVGIDPSADGAASGSSADCACHAREANTAGAGFYFQRAGNVHDANTTAAGLGTDRSANFAEIDLAALRDKLRGAADVLGFDVAGIGLHFDVIAARDRYFELNPELCSV